jgi:hypothetical protein
MKRTTTSVTRAPREHGTVAGFHQHHRQRENACAECKEANRAYHRARYAAMVAEKEQKREEARLAEISAQAVLETHEFIALRPAECDGLTGACTCQVWTTKKSGAKVAFNWHRRQVKDAVLTTPFSGSRAFKEVAR